LAVSAPAEDSERKTAFGFTPFPYDISEEAVETTHKLIVENGSIYALHFDNGIPWKEALENKPFPKKIQDEWESSARKIPAGHKVYVGLAPVGKDRKTIAPASEGSKRPRGFKGSRFDDGDVKKAFLNYARRAVETFRPDYLNLGIEAGELADRDHGAWKRYVKLYQYVRRELKRDHPRLMIGISFGLQSLMEKKVADRAKVVVEESDYLGLSFYPYASSFGEKMGSPALSSPPNQWRKPLQWVRKYTDKPIAICETGYSTRDIAISAYDLAMEGSTDLQKDYVEDLGKIAERDDYLFVIWFLAVDYDELYKKIPEGDGSNKIWRNIGFLDGRLRPKPAWKSWQRIAGGAVASAEWRPYKDSPRGGDKSRDTYQIGFREKSDLFEGPDSPSLDKGHLDGEKAMRWSFKYKKGRWQWATKSVKRDSLGDYTTVSFWIRSDRALPMFFQLEEKGGEAFFAVIDVEGEWKQVELDFDDLQPDPQKEKDGRLDPRQITQILIADEAGASNQEKGKRSIWISGLTFSN
jgi:hypothetical protein